MSWRDVARAAVRREAEGEALAHSGENDNFASCGDASIDLAERESIAIIDGGLPPEWAAALASIERGPRPASISERDWRVALDAVWRRAAEHGAEFAACGWTFSEIFGVGEHWLRLDQRGVAWFAVGARVVSIDAERIVFERGSERRVHRRPH